MQMSAAIERFLNDRPSSSVFCISASAAACERAAERPERVLGLDHVAVAGTTNELVTSATRAAPQPSQAPVRTPVLRELDRRARQVPELLQLALEPLERRECIGRPPAKPAITRPSCSRRTLRAFDFMTVLPA
jgi:hypothetical protein